MPGFNILAAQLSQLKPRPPEEVLDGKSCSSFYCVIAPPCADAGAQRDWILHPHPRWRGPLGRTAGVGPPPTSRGEARVVAISLRSTWMSASRQSARPALPRRGTTPILDKLPVPVSNEEPRQDGPSRDCGDLHPLPRLPPKAVLPSTRVVIALPGHRGYLPASRRRRQVLTV